MTPHTRQQRIAVRSWYGDRQPALMEPIMAVHRSTRRGSSGLRAWARALGVGMLLLARPVVADDGPRIAALTSDLAPGHSEPIRIAAVTELAALGGKPALKPLVAAMTDTSPKVRAVAASGLGRLAHRAALPTLRKAANDLDPEVRKRASEAVTRVCDANGIPVAGGGQGRAEPPRAAPRRPDLFVVVKSAHDDSSSTYGAKVRQDHAEVMRATMASELAGAPRLTTNPSEAGRWGLELNNVDLTILSLATRNVGNLVEVEAKLRVAISNQRGKMTSFLTGGAKVQVPRAGFSRAFLPQLRREALENAVHTVFGDLLAHLRRTRGS